MHQFMTALAVLVLYTDELGKCGPVDNCCSSLCISSPCIAGRQAG